MKILYFAWLRERTGLSAEEVDAGDAATVADLVNVLKERSEGHALAFADLSAVRVAVDQKLTTLEAPIAGAGEIAFFPPMTGG